MDIHRNPWKSMDIQEYSSISKKSWILPDNLEILIFQISMEIHVCPSYHTWISNMVLLEKLVMTSIFKTQMPGRIRPVRRRSLPMVHYHRSLFRQSTNSQEYIVGVQKNFFIPIIL